MNNHAKKIFLFLCVTGSICLASPATLASPACVPVTITTNLYPNHFWYVTFTANNTACGNPSTYESKDNNSVTYNYQIGTEITVKSEAVSPYTIKVGNAGTITCNRLYDCQLK